jgi:alpha-amylase
VKHVEPEFWRYFTQKVRQRLAKEGKKNFFMFGEAFYGDDVLVGSFTKGGQTPLMPPPPVGSLAAPNPAAEAACVEDGVPLNADQLDSAFYFPQYYGAVSSVLRDAGGTKQIQGLWDQRPMNWGTDQPKGGIGIEPYKVPVNFLDNHDVGRFLFNEFFHTDAAAIQAGQLDAKDFDVVRRDKLKNALVFLFTEQGIPCVYYGTEQGLEGGNDPANREDLWDTGYKTDGDVFQWIQKLTALRKKHKALTHGDQKVVWATDHTGMEDDAGIFAFERAGGDAGDGYALVVLNIHRDKASSPSDGGTTMKVSAAPGTTLVDVLSPKQLTYPVAADGTLVISVAKRSAALLVPQAQAN